MTINSDFLFDFSFNRRHHFPKVLFICKSRQSSGGEIIKSPTTLSTGLYNSAHHIVNMLESIGVDVHIANVVDNNSIDREVTKYKPDIVIIEALWVVPEKFDILRKLHPGVKWIIRIHSKVSFLSSEGVALEWIYKYIKKSNVFLGVNNLETFLELSSVLKSNKLVYAPNYYSMCDVENTPELEELKKEYYSKYYDTINVGCFGAIRPLKNHLSQALAAIRFGDRIKEGIHFHINVGRIEGYQSENILKNIRSLFANNPRHTLVENDWLSQDEFFTLLKFIDVGVQVSLSESFNLVAADMVARGIPVVVSKEISWMPGVCEVDNDVRAIADGLFTVYQFKDKVARVAIRALDSFNHESKRIWKELLSEDRFLPEN